jgi:hypothetical protein
MRDGVVSVQNGSSKHCILLLEILVDRWLTRLLKVEELLPLSKYEARNSTGSHEQPSHEQRQRNHGQHNHK